MAEIRFLDNNERIVGEEAVHNFLASQEVIYEHWDINKLPASLRGNYQLTDEQKQQILDAFQSEIDDISKRRGYLTADVIALSEDTPNLDSLLNMFKEEHHHVDDEVRFIVDGHGIFTIKGTDGRYFDVELEAGDLISVPEYYRHYFQLMEDRKVVAIRIFKTPAGWEAIKEEPQV